MIFEKRARKAHRKAKDFGLRQRMHLQEMNAFYVLAASSLPRETVYHDVEKILEVCTRERQLTRASLHYPLQKKQINFIFIHADRL